MSVDLAHSVIEQFDLSPRERKELADLLMERENLKRPDTFQWAKAHFKGVLKKSSEKRKPCGNRANG